MGGIRDAAMRSMEVERHTATKPAPPNEDTYRDWDALVRTSRTLLERSRERIDLRQGRGSGTPRPGS